VTLQRALTKFSGILYFERRCLHLNKTDYHEIRFV